MPFVSLIAYYRCVIDLEGYFNFQDFLTHPSPTSNSPSSESVHTGVDGSDANVVGVFLRS